MKTVPLIAILLILLSLGTLGGIEIAFVTPGCSVTEYGNPLVIACELSEPSALDVEVTLVAAPGSSAVEGLDFTFYMNPIIIPAGTTRGEATIHILEDTITEGDETIILELDAGSAAVPGIPAQCTVTILDNDPGSALHVQFASVFQNTLESASQVTVTAVLSSAVGYTVSVPLIQSVTDTASYPGDYSVSAMSITIGPWQRYGSITVYPFNDILPEPEERLTLLMGQPVNAARGPNIDHTITIVDDEIASGMPFVSFAGSQTCQEGTYALTVKCFMTKPAAYAVTVPFMVTGASTAWFPNDYTAISSSPLTIPAGATEAWLLIDLADDAIEENDELIVLEMGTPTGAYQGGTGVHVITILDNDGAHTSLPTVRFASLCQEVSEDSGAAMIDCRINMPCGFDVVVPYTVENWSTALVPGDYSITPSPVIIPRGSTSIAIVVALVDDWHKEADESVYLTMGTPVNAVTGINDWHILAIIDDDNATAGDATGLAGGTKGGCLPGHDAPKGLMLLCVTLFTLRLCLTAVARRDWE